MDVEFIKEKIYHTDNKRKIQPGEYLPANVIQILKDGNTIDRAACFAPAESSKDPCLFQSEITCSKCGELLVRELTKTKLFEYLKGHKKILCDKCQNNEQELKRELAEKRLDQQQKLNDKIIRITDGYIKSYLDPFQNWDKELPVYARTELIIGRPDVDYNKVSQYIKSMPYKDFLQTMYWKTISSYKKYKENYKCALCGSNKNLSTHHSSYKRHGREHEYMVIDEDLIVLCQDCHGKFHDKL